MRWTAIHDGNYDLVLCQISAQLIALDTYTGVPAIAEALAAVPLPPVLSDLAPVKPAHGIRVPVPEPQQLPAVRFRSIYEHRRQGNAILLHPGAIATINVSANVPAWPTDADSLDVWFASTLTPAMLHISPITLRRDQPASSGLLPVLLPDDLDRVSTSL